MKTLSLLLLSLPTLTLAYRPENFPCRAHFQCASGYCNAQRQCEFQQANGATCTVNEACQSGRCAENGLCQVQFAVGGQCQVNSDCLDGYCNTTLTTCAALKPKIDPCVDDWECNSGRCTGNPRRCEFVIYEGAICGKDNDCFGDRCKMKHQGGDNRCYPRKWNNEFCNHNSDCLSLRCETRNCTEPVWLGEPCDEPSDCYSLFCHTTKGCVATAGETDNDEIEPEMGGISGSASAQTAAGGGSVDIGSGSGSEVFTAGGSNNSGGVRVGIGMAAVVGLVGAAVFRMI